MSMILNSLLSNAAVVLPGLKIPKEKVFFDISSGVSTIQE